MTMIEFKVQGLVQGVGFRYATAKQGRALKLKGWVRNSPDGSVEGMAAGTPEAIGKFKSIVRTGPEGSRVDKADLNDRSEDEQSTQLTDFAVLH